MVWSGVCWTPGMIDEWRAVLGERAGQVLITGPLDRSELAEVVRRAEAAVLPSQVDNLPNTVIESLSAGAPVIGTRGASIDEIVEEGVTGHLVPFGDKAALAAAMVEVWSGRSTARKGFAWSGGVRAEMEPAAAMESLLALARRGAGA
jgi:glycosyltransferase involved in cell wall biosynthesis